MERERFEGLGGEGLLFRRPIIEVVLPEEDALAELRMTNPLGDVVESGTVITAQELHKLYLRWNKEQTPISSYIAYILGDRAMHAFQDSEFRDELKYNRDPGVVIAGSLIDVISIFVPSKVSLQDGVEIVAKTVKWLKTNAHNPYFPGLDPNQILGHCFGRAMVCAGYKIDESINPEAVRKFAKYYLQSVGEAEQDYFKIGFSLGVMKAADEYGVNLGLQYFPIEPPSPKSYTPGV